MRNSYFDGGLVTYIGTSILATLITVCTFGICAPWGICLLYNWKIKHTVINGKRLYFDGTAMQLFGNWIKWLFLTFITLGIYGFWLHIKLEQWRVKHTHVAGWFLSIKYSLYIEMIRLLPLWEAVTQDKTSILFTTLYENDNLFGIFCTNIKQECGKNLKISFASDSQINGVQKADLS